MSNANSNNTNSGCQTNLALLTGFVGLIVAIFTCTEKGMGLWSKVSGNEAPSSSVQAVNPEKGPAPQPEPSPGLPESARLVGSWQFDGYENGYPIRIIYHVQSNGTALYELYSAAGNHTLPGNWRLSQNILYENYPDGSSAKGRVTWYNDNDMLVTILDNGVPAYTGMQRRYVRLR